MTVPKVKLHACNAKENFIKGNFTAFLRYLQNSPKTSSKISSKFNSVKINPKIFLSFFAIPQRF